MMKTEKSKILSNIFWMTFDKVFILLLNVFVTVKVANHYGATEYGVYQYAISVVAILEVLGSFIDGRVVKKQYLETDPSILVWNVTIARLMLSLISLLFGVCVLFVATPDFEFTLIFCLLLFNSIINGSQFGMINRYEYLCRSKVNVLARDIASVLGSLLQLFAVWKKLPTYVLAIIVLITTIQNLFLLFFLYHRDFGITAWGATDFVLIWDMVKESIPLGIAASCAVIYSKRDTVMTGAMLTKADVGVYSIALKLISVVQIALSPIRESVYPGLIRLYHTDKKRYEQRYIQITATLTWIFIFGAALSFYILPKLMFLMNREYEAALPIYKIYIIGSFFMYNAALRAGHFTLIHRGRILMYSQLFSVLINLILNYWLIRSKGLMGAAIATAITQALSLMFFNLFFKKDGWQVFKLQLLGMNPVYIFSKVIFKT